MVSLCPVLAHARSTGQNAVIPCWFYTGSNGWLSRTSLISFAFLHLVRTPIWFSYLFILPVPEGLSVSRFICLHSFQLGGWLSAALFFIRSSHCNNIPHSSGCAALVSARVRHTGPALLDTTSWQPLKLPSWHGLGTAPPATLPH
jgi:hypothetical protein